MEELGFILQYFPLQIVSFYEKAFLIDDTSLQIWLAGKEDPCKWILFVGNVSIWLWWESTYWLNNYTFLFTNYIITKTLRCIFCWLRSCMMIDWANTYFFPNFLGLLITYVALNLMDGHGQPALLYIVPFTLGSFCETDHYL